ncbi:hypothetical protein Pint_11889 [Pistacia integerrima]|uniref:Uncharacterized protein n=1 Tax=Pistacia integerrima TaxID=434235 RepID=A0ACC0XDZ6_9ROSI|nr:hypothetical protein Pint_11889 [Pistacia integerrima]
MNLDHRFQNHSNRPSSIPYQGFCQIYGVQGHTAKRCPSFQVLPLQSSTIAPSSSNNSTAPWQARVNFAANNTSPSSTWLLDSGTSHHVTADLNNLSLHSAYNGFDDVMIGDGTSLSITQRGSTTLSSPHSTFTLSDILCVPTMKKNLISISQFCITNNASVEFLLSSFL